jgi:hypothetical protein
MEMMYPQTNSNLGGSYGSPVAEPGYNPGTLAAIQASLTQLANQAGALSVGMCEIRDRLAGTSQSKGEGGAHPTPVPNGIIDNLQMTINTIANNLQIAESAQKSIFDKLG